MLQHESALRGYSRNIGGSAGKGTHGGSIARPDAMPTREEANHVVRTRKQLINAVKKDNAVVYIADDINVSGAKNVVLGDNVTLVGGFCDPSIKGRGPVIRQQHYERHLFLSKYGKAPTLWGVSLRGPNTSYFDPRDRAKSSKWGSDSAEDWYAAGLWCYDESELEIYGSEFWGWTLAGLEIGSRGHETPATIKRSTFHHNMMETLGYGIEHYNGDIWMDRCFFEACRHGFSGFGYPTEFVDMTNSVIGPADDTNGWCGHALDMHKLDNNLHNRDWTAGGHFRIRNCTSMCTRDLGGYDQEGFAIRGTSKDLSWEDKNHWFQSTKPNAPGKQGDAYRQEVTSGGWDNFEPRDSIYGKRPAANVPSKYGAPRAESKQPIAETPNQPPNQPTPPTDGQQRPNPSAHPATKNMKLTIEGRGLGAQYHIVVHGNAKPTNLSNPGDTATKSPDDNTTIISGYVADFKDQFELEKGAKLGAISSTEPVDLYLGGKRVDTGPHAAAATWQQSNRNDGDNDSGDSGGDGTPDVSQLRKRVDNLAEKLNNARISFESDGS